MATEHPDDLRRKLALIEGDRKAFYESSQAAITKNSNTIAQLRKENKAMALKLKTLKAPSKQRFEEGGSVEQMQEKIHTLISRHNNMRHQAAAKEKQIAELDSKIALLDRNISQVQATVEGESEETQKMRNLENSLDKAGIKFQEAQHISRTYQEIIKKLEQDRLGFDAQVTKLEKAITGRKQELSDLEAMCADACLARDQARKELAAKEALLNSDRAKREAEKKRLSALAEERRRQFDAIEKRMRLASAGPPREEKEETVSEETRDKMESYEQAMKRIREATGVLHVDEVVSRFLAQEETQEHLQKLQAQSAEQLSSLKDDYARLAKQFEALKYSGEARNAGNQRMLNEFEAHLKNVETKCQSLKENTERSTKTLVRLQTGINHLMDKLARLKPVQHRSPQSVSEKLAESELRLARLVEEIESRKDELPEVLPINAVPKILPEYNTRVNLAKTAGGSKSESEEDDDVVSRDAMKRNAQMYVDQKTNKKPAKKKRGTR